MSENPQPPQAQAMQPTPRTKSHVYALMSAACPEFAVRIVEELESKLETAESQISSAEKAAKQFAGLIKEWRDACRHIASDIDQPEDVEGWLVNVNDVSEPMPPEILAPGCAQSPMEYLTRLIDTYDEQKSALATATAQLEAAEGRLKEAQDNSQIWFSRLLEMGCSPERDGWRNLRAERAEAANKAGTKELIDLSERLRTAESQLSATLRSELSAATAALAEKDVELNKLKPLAAMMERGFKPLASWAELNQYLLSKESALATATAQLEAAEAKLVKSENIARQHYAQINRLQDTIGIFQQRTSEAAESQLSATTAELGRAKERVDALRGALLRASGSLGLIIGGAKPCGDGHRENYIHALEVLDATFLEETAL